MSECPHKQLKKQMVGEQFWYVCECGQKFRAWDGKVSVREPGADTGTTVAEELSGMLAERMIKLAIKIQGPYATFGPPESLERRKKSHQERIEELTGMLTTEFAECLERGTTPPEGLEFPWAAETMRLIDVLTPETKGKAFDPDWFLLRQRLEEFERRAATQRAPVEQGRESTRETEITKLQASLTPEERQGNESWGHKADCVLLCSCGYEKPYPLSDLMKDYADYLKWRMAQREQPMPAPDHAREGALRERLLSEPLGDLSFSERLAEKMCNLLTDKFTNSVKIAAGIIKQELARALADGKEGGE